MFEDVLASGIAFKMPDAKLRGINLMLKIYRKQHESTISMTLFCRPSPLSISYNANYGVVHGILSRPFLCDARYLSGPMEVDHIRDANTKSAEKFVEDYFPPR
jgi:hypothetical protein